MVFNRSLATVLTLAALIPLAACGNRPMDAMHDSAPAGEASPGQMMHDGMGHNMDLGPADATYDLRFIDGMIPHQEGAVVMAEDLKGKSTRPELLTLADEIIASQQAEIDQMQQWRQQWYGQ